MMESKMKVLELFAGSRSIGKVAENMGLEVFSVDKFISENMNRVCGVEEITRDFIISEFGEPNIVWASPVCSAWSKTGWFHYWDTDIYALTKQFIAKREFANESIEMVRKTIEIFSWFPNAIFYMENPDAMLQMHPVVKYFKVYGVPVKKHLITYCRYGDTLRKPTNIWTNNFDWHPLPICNNGDRCRVRSPRCTQTGILSKKNSYERSRIPDKLCNEVLESAILSLNRQPQIHTSNQQSLFTDIKKAS
jgi:hypothetical protein